MLKHEFEGLSELIRNTLWRGKLRSIDQLCLRSRDELLKYKQLGVKSVAEIEKWLEARDRHLICTDCKKMLKKYVKLPNKYWW